MPEPHRTFAADHGGPGGTGTGVQSVTGAAPGIVDNTDPDNPVVQAQFGSDTTVKLANAASALVDALRLVLTLSNNTPGAERSEWLFKTLIAGASTNAMRLAEDELDVPGWIAFINDPDTYIQNFGANTFGFATAGVMRMFINGLGVSLHASVGANLQWAGYAAGLFFNPITGNVLLSPDTPSGNVDLGKGTGAYADNASSGFPTFPVCHGTPTGTPTVRAGQCAFIMGNVDTTPTLYYCLSGGSWTPYP